MEIFLSSTQTDLKAEREVLYWALREAGHQVVRMEEFGSHSLDSWHVCIKELDHCDLYLLLIGRRYGAILAQSGLSYTHAEYERAQIKGIPTLAFVKKGAIQRTDPKAEPLRLREFYEIVAAAYQVHHPYFANLHDLALAVREDLAKFHPNTPVAPTFHAIRRSLANPTDYAVTRVERDLLRGRPYKVVIADLHVLAAQFYPDDVSRRLTNKALQIRADLQQRGIDTHLFNEISAYGASDAAVVAKRAKLALQANAIIALVQQPADLELATAHFSAFGGPLILCYPDHLEQPAPVTSQTIVKSYTVHHLNSCDLVAHVEDALHSSIGDYVLSLAA